MTDRQISLKLVTAPSKGIALKAPPVLFASDHSVDYTCGQCGTILLHAEENHVIQCGTADRIIRRTPRLSLRSRAA
jgi:hypothetical protein